MNWGALFADLTIVQGLSGLLVLIAFLLLVLRGWRLLGRLKDYMDDVKGEPPRPGVQERPGLMVRIARTEEKVNELSTSLAEVRHEVSPNTGTSLNDVVRRTEMKVDELSEWQRKHETKSDAVVMRVTALEQKESS